MFFNFKTKNIKKEEKFMNKVISDKIKTSIIEQVVFGDDVRDVAEKYHVSKTSIYRWLNDYKYKQKYKNIKQGGFGLCLTEFLLLCWTV